jgi:IS605 OrfB family transposase
LKSTFEAQVNINETEFAILQVQVDCLSKLERRLFVDLFVRKLDRNVLKSRYIAEYGIMARQFNALRISIEGKVKAWIECEKLVIVTLKGKIAATTAKIKTLQKKTGLKTARDVPTLKFAIHQKKRKLAILRDRLQKHEARLLETPSICFGSRDLFQKQYHLIENRYHTHAEWLKDWRFARNNQFLAVGSRNETAGCHIFQIDLDKDQVKIRLCDEAVKLNGGGESLILSDITVPYGKEQIEAALNLGQSITTRLVLRKAKDDKVTVHLLISVEETPAQIKTCRAFGALGLDLNAKSVALAWIKEDGNVERTDSIPFDLNRKSTDQTTSILSAIAQEVVMLAAAAKIPIVKERLDFAVKKQMLGEAGTRYAQMLSSFAYTKFYELLERCAARHGVEVIGVNPAFTSVIGYIKFGVDRMTVDEAAAVAIARRYLGFKERLRSHSMSPVLRTKLMQASGEKHMRHVWSGWRRFYSWLGRDRKVWASRCSGKGRTEKGFLQPSYRGAQKQNIESVRKGAVRETICSVW